MRFIPEGPDIPESLLNEHAEGKVVLFCGAGVSLDAGYPLFGNLVKEIQKRNPISTTPELQDAIAQGNFDFALSIIQRKLGNNSIKLRRDTASILSKRPATLRNHISALKLSSMRNGQCRIITTNFDRLFTKAAKKLGRLNIDIAPKLPVPKMDRWNSILHLHGMIPSTPDDIELGNLILTSSDFGEAYVTESYCSRFIVELLRNFTVVFIGYSLNDRIMRYLLDAISYSEKFFDDSRRDGHFRKPYAFVEYNEDDKANVIRRWDLKEVTPIPYFVEADLRQKRGSHYRLYNTLDAWADLASGGQNARVTLALNEAPKPFLPEDTFGQQRLLWALRDENGKAAEALANVESKEQTASIDWLSFFAGNGLFDQVYSPIEQQNALAKIQRSAGEPLAERYLGTTTNGNGVSRLKPVTSHMIRWLQWHLDSTQLMDWFLNNGAVPHPDFSWEYSRRKNTNENISITEEQKRFWDVLTSDAFHASQLPANHWFDLNENLDLRNPFYVREFLTHIELKLDIKPSHSRDYQDGNQNFFRQFEIELKFHKHEIEYFVDKILSTPDLQDGLSNICAPLSELVQSGLDWLSLFEKASSEEDFTQYSIPSISPHDQNKNVDDFGKLVFLLRAAFDKLLKHDANSAYAIALQWRKSDYPLFKRLHLYAANSCGALLDESALSLLINDNCKWLWASATKREVHVYLRERVKAWNPRTTSRLCTAILNGPNRPAYREMTESEWHDLRDRHIWRLLAKLEKGGVDLPKRASNRLSKLRETLPYQPPNDHSDEFAIFLGGVRDVRSGDEISATSYTSFTQLTASERIASWKSDQANMLRKLGNHNAMSSLETLEAGITADITDDAFWSKGIEGIAEGIKTENVDKNLVSDIVNRVLCILNKLPDNTINNNRVGYYIADFWREHVNESIDRKTYLETWDRIWFAMACADCEAKEVVDPVSYAINNSAGKITEDLFKFAWPKDAKVGGGLPKELTDRIKIIVNRNSRERIDASSVIVASRTEILHAVDPEFFKNSVLPLLKWDSNPNAAAYWRAYLWQARINPDLFNLMEQEYVSALKVPNKFKEPEYEILCQLFVLASMELKATSDKTVREVLDVVGMNGLKHMSRFIRQRMLNSKQNSSNYWENIVMPWLRSHWPRDATSQSSSTMENFAMIAIYSRNSFPEALSWMEENGLLGETPTASIILYSLQKFDEKNHTDFENSSNLVRLFPKHVLRLLWITRPFQWGHADARKIIQIATFEDPSLLETEEYQDLNELIPQN